MPKPKGKHPERALTAMQVRALKKPGRYADGNGLYLVVDPSGAKRWCLRIVVNKNRRDIGLGGLSLISLAEAREKALAYRKAARAGEDPFQKPETVTVPTFEAAAERVHSARRASWKNKKHGDQWINTLKQYAYPLIGTTPVDKIGTPAVLQVLTPIWTEKPETARRVRQRIGTVLEWAKAAGHRTGEDPTKAVSGALPRQRDKEAHHSAMAYTEVPNFIRLLQATTSNGELARLALEFLILTATRTSEVLKAAWAEYEEFDKAWTIPAERMKAGRPHRVPLSNRCVEILERARELSAGSALMFPGRSADRPMSNMVFLQLLKRMELPVTVHGFRSSFRDWAAETTAHPNELCEMALAHTVRSKVEAAYRRGDLFEKRRVLMIDWANFTQDFSQNASQTASQVPRGLQPQ